MKASLAGVSLACAMLLGSCTPADEPEAAPAPEARAAGPDFRLGIVVDGARATIGGGGAFRVIDPDEGEVGLVDSATAVDVAPRATGVTVGGPVPDITRKLLRIEPVDSGGTVRINGREYRGAIELRRGTTGMTVVNVVALEDYLAGVVGAEMGKRAPGEEEALKAQAIVSRTYALRNKGRWAQRGFDLVADVNDQVYVGVLNENPMAVAAVQATRGEILSYNGEPIEAFFSSTCGGKTEEGSAAFSGASRPYLKSVDDTDPATGASWCAISPRYEWTERWTARQLTNVLKATLPANGLPATRAIDLTDIRVLDRTPSGRIASVSLTGRNGRLVVSGQSIRRVLAMPAGGILRSTNFTVRIDRAGGRIERLEIEGKGNGHAVGMCQWGAVGRARAGHDYSMILTSYFPGAELTRIY